MKLNNPGNKHETGKKKKKKKKKKGKVYRSKIRKKEKKHLI